ncbi:MAG: hypothetical protein U1C33_08700, partial [Candidatus Cloacimonadaceae bacterium]|nr:hypothetical protein [Candidatus Cloacimonadaceae bacterium]
MNIPSLKPVTGLLLAAIIFGLLYYINMPVFSLRFIGWPFVVALSGIPLLGVKRFNRFVRIFYTIMGLYVLVVTFYSLPVFHASRYRDLIGEVKQTEFTELVSPINMEQVPIVDRVFASSLAEKKLGEDFALGSRVTLGWPTRQMVRGKLYWVIPLLHSGFFKWLTNLTDGTPGYIMVSAINPQDITFVRELNGKPIRMKYQQNSYFNQKLHRHLYLNG